MVAGDHLVFFFITGTTRGSKLAHAFLPWSSFIQTKYIPAAYLKWPYGNYPESLISPIACWYCLLLHLFLDDWEDFLELSVNWPIWTVRP